MTTDEPTLQDQQLARDAVCAHRQGEKPGLDDATAMALLRCAAWGRNLAATPANRKSRRLRRAIADGDDALGVLFLCLEDPIWEAAKHEARRRQSPANKEVIGELAGEATLAVMENIFDYEPGEDASLVGWILTVARRTIKKSETSTDGTGVSPVWRAVYNDVLFVRGDPTVKADSYQKLEDAVRERNLRRARKLAAKDNDGTLTDDDINARAERYLVRSGRAKALNNLPDLISAFEKSTSLDQPIGSGPDAKALVDVLSNDDAYGGHQTLSRQNVVTMLDGIGDNNEALLMERFSAGNVSVTKLAERTGTEPVHVRAMTRHAKNRVVAPHAQFARMAPGVESQVVDVVRTPSVHERIASRRLVTAAGER